MSLRRIFQSAVFELFDALRSRRALVMVVLYLVGSLLCMGGSITILGKMEKQLAQVLQVDTSDDGRSGVVSARLWQSKHFQRIVRNVAGDSLVYDDISGRHPAELIYAWFVFFCLPVLTIMLSANRIAADVHSGAVRYMITRVTRLEWTLGKYIGSSALVFVGLVVGAVGAWTVAAFRLAGADIPALLPAMFVWSFKAWLLSLAWLGFALGVSQLFKSPIKADAVAWVLLLVFTVGADLLTWFGGRFAPLAMLLPSGVGLSLWRSSFVPVATAAAWLLALGLLYLSAGYAFFARRDAR